MPLYRLTFRDEDRKKVEVEVVASSMRMLFKVKVVPQNWSRLSGLILNPVGRWRLLHGVRDQTQLLDLPILTYQQPLAERSNRYDTYSCVCALWKIAINGKRPKHRQELSPDERVRIELLITALEDMEVPRQRIEDEPVKSPSTCLLLDLIAALNKAE